MSDEPSEMKTSTRWGLRTLFAVLALLGPIAAWRLSCWLVTPEPYQAIHPGPPVSTWDAESIAIAEVKKREGWSGRGDVQGEGGEWWVHVYRDYSDRRSDPNARWVAVDIHDGHIVAYHAAKE
jgi:hypothetical protein